MTMDEAAVAALRDAELPVTTLEEAIPHLRRPFSPAAVKWKVQSSNDNGGVVVAHLDARLVVERLNAIIPRWSETFDFMQNSVLCHLTIDNVTHTDVGVAADPKAKISDARKRAAVPFGVGVPIYALPSHYMRTGSGKGHLERVQKRTPKGDRIYINLTDGSREWLHDWYADWLKETGEPMFGPVLDHGDVRGAQGLDEQEPGVDEGDAAVPSDVEQLDTPEAEELRGRARLAFDALRDVAPTAMLPAVFAGKLAAAGGSMESLAALIEELNAEARKATGS